MKAVWDRVAVLLMQGVPTREAWHQARMELEPEYRFRRFLEAWEAGVAAARPEVERAAQQLAAYVATADERRRAILAGLPWYRRAWIRLRMWARWAT